MITRSGGRGLIKKLINNVIWREWIQTGFKKYDQLLEVVDIESPLNPMGINWTGLILTDSLSEDFGCTKLLN